MSRKTTILYVDDDTNLTIVTGQYLDSEGYDVSFAGKAAEVLEHLKSNAPDLIILDLGLPDMDGFSLLGQIRPMTTAGILIVSGKSDTTEKIVGLELGADDYLTKPFELRELAARIKAVLRRKAAPAPVQDSAISPAAGGKPNKLVFDGLCIDRDQYQAFNAKGSSLELTSGEFKLLEALALAPNRVLARDYLFELTREGDFDSYDRAIDIQIGRIRKKLGDDPKTQKLIKTVRGVGYMWCPTPLEDVA